ncbi:MAG: formate dehydrogenase, partial [Gammaproteobacteria bacterium]|nr:formate dehydrogenase [Gammaproteobacteria bacterium]
CLGRCFENSAFQISGKNFSGQDIEQLTTISAAIDTNDGTNLSAEQYAVKTTLAQPILTAKIGDIEQYYQLFNKLKNESTTEQLLDKISDSGLRGRGGAGFPTGFKWQSCRASAGDEKYIVCNADEGDAGAYSDRYLLEQRPHSVLFGMLMAGYLVGASTGILYIRNEYPQAIKNTEKAIKKFRKLINSIDLFSGLDFSFSYKVIIGAGSYVCGEETALLRSIEGQRPVVSVRPPFPAQSGLFGCPTVLNNVETFASIHWILSEQEGGFKAMGNGKSTGSKLISLDSCVKQPGIYEVAMGTPLVDVINLAGGYSKSVKALHIGGPLGGVVPVSKVSELNVDFESFAESGFLLGHASIIGIPTEMRMIDYLAHLFEFTANESCGKCYPCSIGSVRGQELVEDAIDNPKTLDLGLLEELLETMELGSLCALGGGVPLPVRNILQYFSEELSPFVLPEKDLDDE